MLSESSNADAKWKKIKKAAEGIICTMCGKPFTVWDLMLEDNRYDIWVGYGSKHDSEHLKFDFCCDCFDKVLDTIIPMCKVNPVIGDDYWPGNRSSESGNGRIRS